MYANSSFVDFSSNKNFFNKFGQGKNYGGKVPDHHITVGETGDGGIITNPSSEDGGIINEFTSAALEEEGGCLC